MSKIVIIDYGAGNVRSVQYALQRLGYQSRLSSDTKVIQQADKVIFPGVGHAASAMAELRKTGLDQLIPQLKQPVLGICLGLQLMCSHSEESNTTCLNIFPIAVKQFDNILKVPHMGWNQTTNLQGALFKGVEENSNVYFVHGYYAEISGYTIAHCDYGTAFSAAMRKDNFYACQFHPEKSGVVGKQILNNFLEL
jgi:glutamine amidotransferase